MYHTISNTDEFHQACPKHLKIKREFLFCTMCIFNVNTKCFIACIIIKYDLDTSL